jgi:hypothetical protein
VGIDSKRRGRPGPLARRPVDDAERRALLAGLVRVMTIAEEVGSGEAVLYWLDLALGEARRIARARPRKQPR